VGTVRGAGSSPVRPGATCRPHAVQHRGVSLSRPMLDGYPPGASQERARSNHTRGRNPTNCCTLSLHPCILRWPRFLSRCDGPAVGVCFVPSLILPRFLPSRCSKPATPAASAAPTPPTVTPPQYPPYYYGYPPYAPYPGGPPPYGAAPPYYPPYYPPPGAAGGPPAGGGPSSGFPPSGPQVTPAPAGTPAQGESYPYPPQAPAASQAPASLPYPGQLSRNVTRCLLKPAQSSLCASSGPISEKDQPRTGNLFYVADSIPRSCTLLLVGLKEPHVPCFVALTIFC
jgi:hypothetical protein